MSTNKGKVKSSTSWSKNWAGRGVAMLNRIESKCSAPIITGNKQYLHKKLDYLLANHPNNEFYLSLKRQSKSNALTEKQLTCIEMDYLRKKKKPLPAKAKNSRKKKR